MAGSLYVRRNLTAASAAAFTEWASGQGFIDLTPAHELHATVVYSRDAVALTPEGGQVTVSGGDRDVVQLGDAGAWVLRFGSDELTQRWQLARDQGASWDHDGYQPHVTICYGGAPTETDSIEPFRGDLVFGPEIHEALDEAWAKRISLHAASMRIDSIEAMALDIPHVPGHPNKMPFSGVLTILDQPSDRPPHGSEGKRVILTTAAATKALPSLLGMAVNYLGSQDGHGADAKIGVITDATIEGKAVKIGGFIYARDHPLQAASIKASKDVLGFSYELADIYATEVGDCWGITECVFTGAAILRKDKAAYHGTSLAASADGDTTMTKEEIAAAVAESLASSLGAALKPVTDQLAEIKASADASATAIAETKASEEARAKDAAKVAEGTEIETLKTQIADLKAAAEKDKQPDRKTLPPQFSAILARADLALPGEGEKLAVGAVDAALAKANMSIADRMHVKSELSRQGAL